MEKFLDEMFLKDCNNLFIVHDGFTFWEFFKILRKNDYEPEETINFIFANCSLSALVFQECINNEKIFCRECGVEVEE